MIPGHEAVMSIVKVGEGLEDKFQVGQRFIIQADIYVNGKGYAYGYALNGGMAQYSILGQEVLNGDEGCYLLPLSDKMPSAIAALLEPWTCVFAAYHIGLRSAPLDGGKMGFMFGAKAQGNYEFGDLLSKAAPAEVVLAGAVPAGFAEKVGAAFPKAKLTVSESFPEGMTFDDIFLCGIGGDVHSYQPFFGLNARVNLMEKEAISGLSSVDVGSIHYQGWFFQGSADGNFSSAYGRNVRTSLKKGGTCWLPGGAGAMGQMHTQLAVTNPDGPSKIIVSDMDDTRLANVDQLLRPAAEARGVEFKLVNPSKMSPAEFDALLDEFAPEGFDDIVMLVPVAPLVSAYAKFLGKDGLMNIFAGIPAGKEATLCCGAIANGGARFIGSSGSKTQDLRNTIKFVQEGILKPVSALAAIGGMNVLKEGLEAVAAAKFPGKTVIFPNCPDMPLTGVNDIATLVPGLEKTFDADGNYSVETEKALLAKFEK
ncbi:MAG: hypothetical protein IKA79_07480 [Lentisphaeria bacterium]|nr:hypothetical protein [Lentisphaeria bacterium]